MEISISNGTIYREIIGGREMNKVKKLLINVIGSSYIVPVKIRKKLYTLAGIDVREVSEIRSRCFFNNVNVKFEP